MTLLVIDTHQGPATFYRCDLCRKTRNYLSDSWSEIAIYLSDGQHELIHHCLECRSQKKEHRESAV